jgi:hypothetical protein
MKPRRPQSHITGDVAEKQVALTLASWGWTANHLGADYGEDLACNIFTAEQRTNFYFRVQVKGTGEKRTRRYANGDYCVQISADICRQWRSEYFPIFLAVYDESLGKSFWACVSDALGNRQLPLNKKEINFRVPKNNELVRGKESISAAVGSFYKTLLRLENPCLACNVFSVRMPRHRNDAYRDNIWDSKVDEDQNTIAYHTIHREFENLPGWLSALQSLAPGTLWGVRLSSQNLDLERFTRMRTELLSRIGSKAPVPGWRSFVIGPVHFESDSSQPDGAHRIFWNEITDWDAQSIVGLNKIVRDSDHAFKPPEDCLQTIGRRATSWDGHYYVKRKCDLAIRLLVRAPTSSVEFARAKLYRASLRAQILPWICKKSEVSLVNEAVRKLDLVFNEMPDAVCAAGEFSGVIAPAMMNPHLGMFRMLMSWDELESGLRSILEQNNVLKFLPGREGDESAWRILEQLFARTINAPPHELMFDVIDFRRGLPLELDRRVVVISRFRRKMKCAPTIFPRKHEKSRQLSAALKPFGKLTAIESFLIPGLDHGVACVEIHFQPNLALSSRECFEAIKPSVENFIDSILSAAHVAEEDSYSALHLEGQLYFEGHEKYLFL